jgi:hypothetical protein
MAVTEPDPIDMGAGVKRGETVYVPGAARRARRHAELRALLDRARWLRWKLTPHTPGERRLAIFHGAR